ncbi:MAG: hypothetical protein ACOCXJ_09450, partial [Planctomycetota bacterium]
MAMRVSVLPILLCLLTLLPATAQELALRSPLSTPWRLAVSGLPDAGSLRARVRVPDGAPADLGIGAFACDREGRWMQYLRPGTLGPGTHALSIPLADGSAWHDLQARRDWSPLRRNLVREVGFFLWSGSDSRVAVHLSDIRVEADAPRPAVVPRIHAVDLQGYEQDAAAAQTETGAIWRVYFRLDPWPRNPFDPDQCAVDLVVVRPDGSSMHLPTFYREPHVLRDGGDREIAIPAGPGHMQARFTPTQPGLHALRLELRSPAGS